MTDLESLFDKVKREGFKTALYESVFEATMDFSEQASPEACRLARAMADSYKARHQELVSNNTEYAALFNRYAASEKTINTLRAGLEKSQGGILRTAWYYAKTLPLAVSAVNTENKMWTIAEPGQQKGPA